MSESGLDGAGKHSSDDESRNKTSSSPSNTITQTQTVPPQVTSTIPPTECSVSFFLFAVYELLIAKLE